MATLISDDLTTKESILFKLVKVMVPQGANHGNKARMVPKCERTIVRTSPSTVGVAVHAIDNASKLTVPVCLASACKKRVFNPVPVAINSFATTCSKVWIYSKEIQNGDNAMKKCLATLRNALQTTIRG